MNTTPAIRNRPLKLLIAASEVVPFSKSGGLADVAGALPKYLATQGHDCRVLTPRYLSVKENRSFSQTHIRRTVDVQIRDEIKWGSLWKVEESDPQVLLVDQPQYFDRPELYGEKGIDYPDNPMRFAFFSRAVLETIRKTGWVPDIIHCQDWQTALIPLFLKEFYSEVPEMKNIKTVFTFHNANFQGPKNLGLSFLDTLGLRRELYTPDALEYYKTVNLLKAGLIFADAVNTVSPTYANEVRGGANDSYDYGVGLTGLYQALPILLGILNGLDYEVWNPETDEALGNNKYGTSNAKEAKAKLKEELQAEFGLPNDPKLPLIGTVGRIDQGQKGYGLLPDIIPGLANKAQIVLLGTGDPQLEQELSKLSGETFGLRLAFDSNLAQKIYAACDMFLMPSRYEPCGLTQMIALRYGTIPIVRITGGLADTIIDISRDLESGNGFEFEEYSSAAMAEAIHRAIEVFNSEEVWSALQMRGMQTRFLWDDSGKEYEDLFYGLSK
ncbi:MAG: glycogen synthase [Candidatus Saganbacteria bacterium]|nr:glycogen synthase [Candidatus Saganbacteria bacterium]